MRAGVLEIRGWRQFQHYKGRRPPWIKLHHSLLDDYDFIRLPLASRALAPMLWLLASESEDGSVTSDAGRLAFRLHWDHSELVAAIKPLILSGFLVGVLDETDDASAMLAARKQLVPPEERRDRGDTEERRERERAASAAHPPANESVVVEPHMVERQALRTIRSEINGLLVDLQAVDPRGRDGQELLTGASRVGNSCIRNVESCGRLGWLTTTRDKLLEALMVARADQNGRGVAPRNDRQQRERDALNAAMEGGRLGAGTVGRGLAGDPGGRAGGLADGSGRVEGAGRALPQVAGRSGADVVAVGGGGGAQGVPVVSDDRGDSGSGRDRTESARVAASGGGPGAEPPDGGGDRGGAPGSKGGPGAHPAGDRDGGGGDSAVAGNGVAAAAWASVVEQLRSTLPARAFDQMLGPTRALTLEPDGPGSTLTVEMPARSLLWLQSTHAQELQDAVDAAGLENTVVELRPVAARAPSEAGGVS